MPDIHVHVPWCVSAFSVFAVLEGATAKSEDRRQLQDLSLSHSFWPSHATAGLSPSTHTLSPGKCQSAAPSPTSSFLLTPCSPLSSPRLTTLWMPVASSHGADNSHTSVSISLCPLVHSVVSTEDNGITANSSLILFCFVILLFLLLCLYDNTKKTSIFAAASAFALLPAKLNLFRFCLHCNLLCLKCCWRLKSDE